MSNTPAPGQNWTCPYCNRDQVIDRRRHALKIDPFYEIEECEIGNPGYAVHVIVCANSSCRKMSLQFFLGPYVRPPGGSARLTAITNYWRLLPQSSAKPQPDYIPKSILDDYYEACAIRDLSPKASATVARRCLQGMIRSFCAFSKSTLKAEIDELDRRVASGQAPAGVLPDTVKAIDDVRKIGNIGAHMEKDINVIVDIDPGEVQKLLGLIELLFREWYVAAHERAARLQELSELGAAKQAARKAPPPPESVEPE